MKKIIVLFAIFALTLTSLNAQEKTVKFDIAGELGMPMGDFSDVAGFGFGLSTKAYYPFNEQMDFTVLLGYDYFSGKDVETLGYNYEYSYSALPILFGVKYDLSNVTPGFYAGGETGFTVMMFSYDYEYENPYTGQKESYSFDDSTTEFTFGFSAGYEVNNFDISAGMRLVDMGNLNYLVVRVGYFLPSTITL